MSRPCYVLTVFVSEEHKKESDPVAGPVMAQGVDRGIALLFHDRSTRRGEASAARPGRSLPPGKTRYPLYRRLGGPQGRSGGRKISPHRDSIPGPSSL